MTSNYQFESDKMWHELDMRKLKLAELNESYRRELVKLRSMTQSDGSQMPVVWHQAQMREAKKQWSLKV